MAAVQKRIPIEWTCDEDDDCSASWEGLLLRAEWIDDDWWWWAVYDMGKEELIVDCSNNRKESFPAGETARQEAELVARNYRIDGKVHSKQ